MWYCTYALTSASLLPTSFEGPVSAPNRPILNEIVQQLEEVYNNHYGSHINIDDSDDFLNDMFDIDKLLERISSLTREQINQKDSENQTLLHLAFVKSAEWYEKRLLVQNQDHILPKIVTALLERDIGVDAADDKGRTALHLACKSSLVNAPDVVKLLLCKGAKSSIDVLEAAAINPAMPTQLHEQLVERYEGAWLAQRWRRAPYIAKNASKEYEELYNDTKSFLYRLNKPKRNAEALTNDRVKRQAIIDGLNLKQEEVESFTNWVCQNTSFGWHGAYGNLLKLVDSVGAKSFDQMKDRLNARVEFNAEAVQGPFISLPLEVQKKIFIKLNLPDRLALRATSKSNQTQINQLFALQDDRIDKWGVNALSLAEEELSLTDNEGVFRNLNSVKKFFGPDFKKVVSLSLGALAPKEQIDTSSFPNLRYLSVKEMKMLSDVYVEESLASEIQGLHIRDCIDASYTHLEKFKNLETLILQDIDDDCKGLTVLRSLEELETLICHSSNSLANDMSFLEGLENLKELHLINFEIVNFNFLRKSPLLQKLYVHHGEGFDLSTEIDLKGLELHLDLIDLRIACSEIKSLTCLPPSIKTLALASYIQGPLPSLPNLQNFRLEGSLLENLNFLQDSKYLNTVYLSKNCKLNDVTALKNKNLVSITIDECPLIDFSFIKKLESCDSLKSNQHLKNLSISKCWFQENLDFLLGNPDFLLGNLDFLQGLDLTSLSLSSIGPKINQINDYLRKGRNLIHLKIADKALSTLDVLRHCPNLRTLDLSSSDGLDEKSLESLSCCTQLERFDFSCYYSKCNIVFSISPLSSCINLKSLDLAGRKIKDFHSLLALKDLRKLDIRNCSFFDGGNKKLSPDQIGEFLADLVYELKALKYLNIRDIGLFVEDLRKNYPDLKIIDCDEDD
jgi:hypothetical protein